LRHFIDDPVYYADRVKGQRNALVRAIRNQGVLLLKVMVEGRTVTGGRSAKKTAIDLKGVNSLSAVGFCRAHER
jgi:hypothetical protein